MLNIARNPAGMHPDEQDCNGNAATGLPIDGGAAAPVYVMRCKPDLTITYANGALCDLLGVFPVGVLGRRAESFKHGLPTGLPGAIKQITIQQPIIELPANQPASHIDWTCHGFFNDRGQVIGIQVSGHTRQPLGRLQADARLSEERLRDFAEIGSDWFWETDAENRVTYISKSWESFTRLTYSEVRGRKIDECWRSMGLDPSEIESAIESVRKRVPAFEFERSQHGRDGKLRRVLVRARAYNDLNGAFAGYRGIGCDISEEREAERQLKRAKETAEYASRAKSDFLANMSHELRTPLNSVLGYSELMKDQLMGPIGSERYRNYAQNIHLSASHLLEIINDILDLSKVEAGSQELREEAVALVQVFNTCQTIIAPRAEEAGLAFDMTVASTLGEVLCDKTILNQILLNLLTNAVKFTPEGGSVKADAVEAADGAVAISVTDTGIGVAEQDQERILEPFTQVAPADSRGHRGTGLGLSLTRSLVELHGGSLSLESALGTGTTVTVLFPAARNLSRRGR